MWFAILHHSRPRIAARERLQFTLRCNATPKLPEAVQGSSEPTQAAFKKAIAVVGTDLYKFFKEVRNSLGFYYQPGTVRYTVGRLAERVPDLNLSLSVGSDNLQWYYEPGDRIVDSFIVRDVFRLAEDADAVKEVDSLIHEMQDVAEQIAAFAGYFIMEAAM